MTNANDTKALATLRDCMRWGISLFESAGLSYGHGMASAADEAVYLTLHALHLPPDFAESWFDTRVTDSEREAIVRLLRLRVDSRKPAAQLTGEAWFAGLHFEVTDDVLVPRSPLAELIEAGFAPWVDSGGVFRALDLCTGSGCIGIATAYALPWARVDCVDLSPLAVAVAQRNVDAHGLQNSVRVMESDVFSACAGETYDLIVSNPPYVPNAVVDALPAEYQHEPRMGLAAGDDGMDIVERILKEAAHYLSEHGVLIVEVGLIDEDVAVRWPQIPFTWVEFERGGEGVFLLTAEQLRSVDWSDA